MPSLKKLKNMMTGKKKGGSAQEPKQAEMKQQEASPGGSSFDPARSATETKSPLEELYKANEVPNPQKEKYLGWGIAIANGLANIAEASEILAPLKSACVVTSSILEIIQSMERNKEAWKLVLETLKSHSVTFNSQLAKMIDEDSAPDPDSLLLSPIKAYARELEILLAALLQENGVLADDVPNSYQGLRALISKFGTTSLERDRIQGYTNRLKTAMEKFNVSICIYMGVEAQRVNQQLLRIESKLSSNPEGSNRQTYGPIGSGGTQHATCLEGTRTGVLNAIDEWSMDPHPDNQVYCIGDVAGTGKSTIASHMAHKWEKEKRLAGRFFFSRGTADTENAGDLCFAVAHELKDNYPKLREQIRATMKRKMVISASDVSIQWQALVVDHLAQLQSGPPIILVIDAFDECRAETRRTLLECILKTFCGKSSVLPHVRVFFTTRLEPDIRPLIEATSSVSLHHLRQSKSEQLESLADVGIYINHHLSLSAPSITVDQRVLLIDRSEGLFIFASTACSLLKQSKEETRQEVLASILATNGFTNLDALYYEVLRRALPRDSLSKEPLKVVLGIIISAQQPLSMTAISTLLPPSNRPIPVKRIVLDLASVLASGQPDDPVFILHPTFREFLHQQKRSTTAYVISRYQGHSILASSCLTLILSELKYDLCGLIIPGTPSPINEEIPDLTEKILRCTSSALRYAIVHWVAHGSLMMHRDSICQMIRSLFENKLFNWLEIVSLLGATNSFVQSVRHLRTTMSEYKKLDNSYLRETDQAWCLETLQFMAFYQPLLMISAMQVYVSTLVYWNRAGLIYRNYGPEYGINLPHIPLGMPSVPPTNLTLHGHTDSVRHVEFSPQGDHIASSGDDNTLKLWDTITGAMITSIDGSHGCFLFAPDGDSIFSCWGEIMTHWDVKAGNPLGGPWQVASGHIYVMCYSPDGTRILCGTGDGCIVRVVISTGHVDYRGQVHEHAVLSLAYSPDGKSIATGSRDNKVCLWNSELTESPPKQILCLSQEAPVIQVSFSPLKPLLITTNEAIYRIYNSKTGAELYASPGLYVINCMASSSDGRYAVIDDQDSTLSVWDAETGASVGDLLRGHTNTIRCVVFSPDGKLIASGSADTTVRTWATSDLGRSDASARGHIERVRSLSFSPDHKLLVSVADDETLCIWDIPSGRLSIDPIDLSDLDLKHTIFSPDGELLLCAASTHDIRFRSSSTGKFMGKKFPKYHPDPSYIIAIAFSPDSQLIVMTAASAHRGVGWEMVVWRVGKSPRFQHSCEAVISIDIDPYKIPIEFDADGRHVCWAGKAWDVTVHPPIPVLGDELERVLLGRFAPTVLRYHDILRSPMQMDSSLDYANTKRSGPQAVQNVTGLGGGSYTGWIDIGSPPVCSYALSRDFPVQCHLIDKGFVAFGGVDGRVMVMDFSHLPAYQQAVEQSATSS